MPSGIPLSVLGGLALLLHEMAPTLAELLGPVDAMLKRIGGCRSQAFKMRNRLRKLLSSVLRERGRPASNPAQDNTLLPVMEACFDYTTRCPGAISIKNKRHRYSEGYRRFVVELAGPGGLAENLSVADLSRATRVPEGTLKNWLSPKLDPGGGGPSHDQGPDSGRTSEVPEEQQPERSQDQQSEKVSETVRDVHLRQLFALWTEWRGTFVDFCRMVAREYRLPFSMTFIGDALQAGGLRSRERRNTGQAPWTAGTFRPYFPGAQWLGDGTSIAVRFLDQVFVFNVEYLHDIASDAGMGFHISDVEDEEALLRAFEAGVETAGAPPFALTLDNRPSNHTPAVEDALSGTLILRSTPGRAESKAPIEGAFGLFQQSMPPLNLQGQSRREVARSFLEAVMTAWFRGRNGRPRPRLGGQSPAEAYRGAAPTPQEVDRAMRELRERQRRQEKATGTLNARRDPVRLRLATEGLADLGIPDPKGSLATTLARYSRDAIAYGLAIFRTKQEQQSLPPGADHRYLAGIIRNDHEKRHLVQFSEHLLEQRVRLRDFSLASLDRHAENLRTWKTPFELPQVFVDLALKAEFDIDFRYWTRAAAGALELLPSERRHTLYQHLCRLIAGSFKIRVERRETLIDRLAAAATSLAA